MDEIGGTTGTEVTNLAGAGGTVGLAGEIARSLHDLIGLRSPTVSVLLGQGAGGAALALLPADRTIAAQHAWLSPLPPEGASAIVHRTVDMAPEMSASQGVHVASLYANGLVDHIVDERPDAALEGRAFCGRMALAVEYELSALAGLSVDELLVRRVEKFREVGAGASRRG